MGFLKYFRKVAQIAGIIAAVCTAIIKTIENYAAV